MTSSPSEWVLGFVEVDRHSLQRSMPAARAISSSGFACKWLSQVKSAEYCQHASICISSGNTKSACLFEWAMELQKTLVHLKVWKLAANVVLIPQWECNWTGLIFVFVMAIYMTFHVMADWWRILFKWVFAICVHLMSRGVWDRVQLMLWPSMWWPVDGECCLYEFLRIIT